MILLNRIAQGNRSRKGFLQDKMNKEKIVILVIILGLPRFTGAPENRGSDLKGAGAPVHPKNCGAPALLKEVISLELFLMFMPQ